MKRFARVSLVVGSTFTLAGMAACSPGDDIVPVGPVAATDATNTYTLHEGVVQADASAARDAVVVPGSITLPYAGHESLLETLKPGMIYFGDRAPGMPDSNPLGFNAHVDSIVRKGDRIVIGTHPANIIELFDHADFGGTLGPANAAQDMRIQGFEGLRPLDVSQGEGSFTIPIAFDFGKLFEGDLGSGNTTATGSVSLSGGVGLTLATTAGFRYEDRGWFSVPNLAIAFKCGADLELSACAKVEGSILVGKSEHDGLIAFDGEPHNIAKKITLGSLTIPLAVPPPLVVTGRYTAEIECGLNYSREIGVAYQYKNHYELDTRFGTQDGNPFGSGSFKTDGGHHTWEFLLKGGLKLTCSVGVKVGYYFYDRAGIYVKAEPGAELGISGALKLSSEDGQKPVAQAQACAGFDALIETKWGAEADLGWFGNVGREWDLLETARLALPFPMQKCAQNFQASDGCAGKEDGTYCSAVDTRGSYKCVGGATAAGGTVCQSGQYCQPEGATIGAKAQQEGESAKCGSSPPRAEDLELGFCPDAPTAEPAASSSGSN